MLDWLQNSRADYVLAAYGAAVLALLALVFSSWRMAHRAQKTLRAVEPPPARLKG